ncbi:MAG: response regulator receiver, partial [Chloroflexi bacterium]|nr:response regulator receiver [Chloroflexota bacterium]
GYRVVVAEDNQQIRELLKQQLVELGHTVVGEARDGAEVVTLATREKPDVVVIDWGLPIQDGLAATSSITRVSPTAVVILSAYVAGGDPEADAREAGAHAFLAKPYLIEDLDEALEQAVKRYKRTTASAAKLGRDGLDARNG